jgi:hypothetical protein
MLHDIAETGVVRNALAIAVAACINPAAKARVRTVFDMDYRMFAYGDPNE